VSQLLPLVLILLELLDLGSFGLQVVEQRASEELVTEEVYGEYCAFPNALEQRKKSIAETNLVCLRCCCGRLS
jgi:hypothetical protein